MSPVVTCIIMMPAVFAVGFLAGYIYMDWVMEQQRKHD